MLHSATSFFWACSWPRRREVLFNKEEADILLHRPVAPRTMLWAKVRVLVEVSLWLAGAFNLAGFFVGAYRAETGWLFPIAHALSTTLEALFCTGSVVVVYQLCLRWFGRERLDGLMTTAQVVFAIAFVVGGQVPVADAVPWFFPALNVQSWWVSLLPTAWFAGFDDSLSGSGAGFVGARGLGAWRRRPVRVVDRVRQAGSGLRGGIATIGRDGVPDLERSGAGRRWADVLADAPPLRWWLRDSVSRASFLLVTAYLARDRT
jgi:ABC-2 type transport system permease protein